MRARLLANLVFNLAVAVWVWHDARRRRARKPLFAAVLALLWGPLGVAFWAAERPLAAGERRQGGTGWVMATTFVLAWSALVPTVFVLAWPVLLDRSAVPGSLGDALGVPLATAVVTTAIWLGPALLAAGMGFVLRTSSVEAPRPPAPASSVPLGAAVAVAATLTLIFAISQVA